MDVISLTQELISFNNINPPGNEAAIARYTGALLEENGFRTSYFPYGDPLKNPAERKVCHGA
jgi:succinyl-diaminopimelate desuccinylase